MLRQPLAPFLVLAVTLVFATDHTYAQESIADTDEITDASEVVIVPTTRLVAESQLQSDGVRIAPQASIFRTRAFYSGEFFGSPETVVGTRALKERIAEVGAVHTLRAMKRTDVYKDALKNSASAPVKFGKSVVNEPVDTVKNVGRGVGRFFADVGYSIVSKDPNQDNVAKTAVGFAAAKRALAYELGVNPYTDFKTLEDELSEVAWTTVGGGLTVSAGLSAARKGSTTIQLLSATKTANRMRLQVRDDSPRELQNLNDKKLEAMGIKPRLREALLDNFNFDPDAETRLVGALDAMRSVRGRDRFVQRAALADSRSNARELRDWAELLESYHANVAPAKEIVVFNTAPMLALADGSVAGVFPTDYVIDSQNRIGNQTADLMRGVKASGFKPGPLWFTGPVDPALRDALLARGWPEVKGNVEDVLLGQ